MEKTKRPRKPIPYEIAQLLYGVSILLTFGVISQIAMRLS